MQLRFYKYDLPFARPFKTVKGIVKSRRGIFLQLRKNSITALGEAAPLPGVSPETLEQVSNQIQELHGPLYDLFASDFSIESLRPFCEDHRVLPSLEFGLLTLSSTYLAQQMEKSLRQFLFPNAPNSIPLNAVIDVGPPNLQEAVQKAVSNGFKTIKFKIRNDTSFLSQLEQIRQQHPRIKIRLDANQSWSMQQAIHFLKQAEPLDIEYCEEPLAHPDEESMIELNLQTSIPIALDESLATSFSLEKASKMAAVLIIKPMLLGGAEMMDKLEMLSKNMNTKLIFTSSLESGIGRLMTANLAAGLGSKEAAHGLATGSLLANDVWDDVGFTKDGSFILCHTTALETLMHTDLHKLTLEEIKF